MSVKGKGPQRFPYGVSFDDLPEGAIIAVGEDPTKDPIDSGGRYLDDGTTLMPKLAVGSESVDVGAEVVLTDNAANVGFRRNSDDLSRALASVEINSDGYARLVRQEFKEETTIDLNTTEVEVNTNLVVQFERGLRKTGHFCYVCLAWWTSEGFALPLQSFFGGIVFFRDNTALGNFVDGAQ